MVNTLTILAVFCLSVCSTSQGSTKITVEPSDVVEGEPVTLTCIFFYHIIWYRNSTRVARCILDCDDLYSYYNTTNNRVNRTSSIYIQNVSISRDSGTWKCEDIYYGFSANTTLDVKELTRNLTLICLENTRFIAGQSIDITCKTEVTYPSTNITWYIDTADKSLTEGITTDIQDGVLTSRLRLTLEKQLNNHSLYCSAFNGYGKVQTDFLKLDLTRSTKITVEPSDVVEGEPVTLTCTLDSSRFYYIMWYRNSTTVASCQYGHCDERTSYYNTTMNHFNRTSSIYIQNVSKSRDNGTWKCINIYYRPHIFTVRTILVVKELTGNLTLICPENLRFIAGQSIDIECKTEVTYPTTNITWYIDTGDNRLHKDITTDIQGGISTSSFRLTPEKQLNNHSLYCSDFNGYGKVQTDFLKLDITYPPTIHIVTEEASAVIAEATSIAIAEGGQLLLTCSVQDANPRVPPHGYTWSRNGIKLIDQTSDIFKVDSTSSHDTGNYSCTGNNGIGTGISSPVKVYVIPRVYEDMSGIVTGLAVGLALFMVLSIVLSLLIAYLILIIRRLTTEEVSNYEGLELDNRDENQYASSNVASVPDTSPEQEYDNQASDIAATKGDNSLYENLEGTQASTE